MVEIGNGIGGNLYNKINIAMLYIIFLKCDDCDQFNCIY